jgi:hypothetical protein
MRISLNRIKSSDERQLPPARQNRARDTLHYRLKVAAALTALAAAAASLVTALTKFLEVLNA